VPYLTMKASPFVQISCSFPESCFEALMPLMACCRSRKPSGCVLLGKSGLGPRRVFPREKRSGRSAEEKLIDES